jgi:aminoglycoside 2'-N-acetyltransferase I
MRVTLNEGLTSDVPGERLAELRRLLESTFADGFSDHDWTHTLGGIHVWVADAEGRMISHAALVERTLICSGHTLRAGYVEAVATLPSRQRQGYGSAVMRRLGELVHERYEVGALSTGEQAFYERFGWERWRGPTCVDGPDGRARTLDDDGSVMILRTSRTPALDRTDAIVCDWRTGDVW